jgi:hypothetical protein
MNDIIFRIGITCMVLSTAFLAGFQVYENSKKWVNVSPSAVLESDLDRCTYEAAQAAYSAGSESTIRRQCMKSLGWDRR